jgi:hypothetical protein
MVDTSFTPTGQLSGTQPIFLSGVYRSGTTFLTAVINNIPNISAASSTVKYLRFCLPHYQRLDVMENLNTMLDEIAARIKSRWALPLNLAEVLAKLEGQKKTHASVYNAVMQALLLENGGARWAEKLAMQWRDIPLFLNMFPDGQVIHIFRDPRDVTASYKKMTYEPWPTFLDASLNCMGAMIDLPKLQNQFGKERLLILRAEDLAFDLIGETARICEFLNEPFDPALSNLKQFSDIKGENWRTNTSFEENTNNYETATPRWVSELTPEELFLVEMTCQPKMNELGYVGSCQDITKIDQAVLKELISDPWYTSRLNTYLTTGLPEQGYRSDPYRTEMEIVFGKDGF